MLNLKKQSSIVFILIIFALNLFATEKYSTFFEKYGAQYNIPPQILWGIAKTESDFNPKAININSNGTYDLGLMQINSIHLPELIKNGLKASDLFDPEVSIAVGADILYKCFSKHGQNWKGLTCYNGKIQNNNYAIKIILAIKKEIKS